MSEQERRAFIARYLDGELEAEEAAELSARLRDDPALRHELAAFERLDDLVEAFAATGVPAPEEGFEARVMARVALRSPPRRPLWTRLAAALTRSPVSLSLAGAGAVSLGLVLGLLLAGRTPAPTPASPAVATAATPAAPAKVLVNFSLRAPGARRVSVAGTFNGWSATRTPMTEQGGVWHVTVPVARGRQEYLFVVDGRSWILDPAAPAVASDGFGGKNAVLDL